MTNDPGTPKSLEEAIENGLRVSADLKQVKDFVIADHVRDFLAQKFSAVLLKTYISTEAAIEDLWRTISGEDLRERARRLKESLKDMSDFEIVNEVRRQLGQTLLSAEDFKGLLKEIKRGKK